VTGTETEIGEGAHLGDLQSHHHDVVDLQSHRHPRNEVEVGLVLQKNLVPDLDPRERIEKPVDRHLNENGVRLPDQQKFMLED